MPQKILRILILIVTALLVFVAAKRLGYRVDEYGAQLFVGSGSTLDAADGGTDRYRARHGALGRGPRRLRIVARRFLRTLSGGYETNVRAPFADLGSLPAASMLKKRAMVFAGALGVATRLRSHIG